MSGVSFKCFGCRKPIQECMCRSVPHDPMLGASPSARSLAASTRSVSASTTSTSSTCTYRFHESNATATQQLARFIKQHHRTPKTSAMNYKHEQISSLLQKVKQVLSKQETLVRCRAPMKIVGDIHGQYTDLRRLIRCNGRPPDTQYLFLGDYVDRGRHSLECVMLLFAYKALYPESVILLRGNHECWSLNRAYGFYDELQRRGFGNLYPEFNRVFDWLPLAALMNSRILCMHGGISQLVTNLDQIRRITRPITMESNDCPDIAMDLLWADPDKRVKGFVPSPRFASYVFGMDALDNFCRRLKLDLIVRAHQVVEKGFERMGKQKTQLVTLFSAPNYCNEMDNSAAVMIVGEQLSIHFSVLEPSDDRRYVLDRNEVRAHVPSYDVMPSHQP